MFYWLFGQLCFSLGSYKDIYGKILLVYSFKSEVDPHRQSWSCKNGDNARSEYHHWLYNSSLYTILVKFKDSTKQLCLSQSLTNLSFYQLPVSTDRIVMMRIKEWSRQRQYSVSVSHFSSMFHVMWRSRLWNDCIFIWFGFGVFKCNSIPGSPPVVTSSYNPSGIMNQYLLMGLFSRHPLYSNMKKT